MKYLVNETAISYKFITGLVLKKNSAMAIEEDKLEGLKKDFQFKSLTDRKLVLVTENKPKSLISADEEIAEKDAEILSTVNTENVERMVYVMPMTNIIREDIAKKEEVEDWLL